MSAQDLDQILCCPHGCEAERGETCGAATVGPEIRAALTAAGWAVVPREPTRQVLDAWESVTDWQENTKDGARYALLSAADNARGEPFYRAMIAAGEATNDGR